MRRTPSIKILVGMLFFMCTIVGCSANNELNERTKWLVERDQLVDKLHLFIINELSEEDLKVIWKNENKTVEKPQTNKSSSERQFDAAFYRTELLIQLHAVGVFEIAHDHAFLIERLDELKKLREETSGRVQQYYNDAVKLIERSFEEGAKRGLAMSPKA